MSNKTTIVCLAILAVITTVLVRECVRHQGDRHADPRLADSPLGINDTKVRTEALESVITSADGGEVEISEIRPHRAGAPPQPNVTTDHGEDDSLARVQIQCINNLGRPLHAGNARIALADINGSRIQAASTSEHELTADYLLLPGKYRATVLGSLMHFQPKDFEVVPGKNGPIRLLPTVLQEYDVVVDIAPSHSAGMAAERAVRDIVDDVTVVGVKSVKIVTGQQPFVEPLSALDLARFVPHAKSVWSGSRGIIGKFQVLSHEVRGAVLGRSDCVICATSIDLESKEITFEARAASVMSAVGQIGIEIVRLGAEDQFDDREYEYSIGRPYSGHPEDRVRVGRFKGKTIIPNLGPGWWVVNIKSPEQASVRRVVHIECGGTDPTLRLVFTADSAIEVIVRNVNSPACDSFVQIARKDHSALAGVPFTWIVGQCNAAGVVRFDKLESGEYYVQAVVKSGIAKTVVAFPGQQSSIELECERMTVCEVSTGGMCRAGSWFRITDINGDKFVQERFYVQQDGATPLLSRSSVLFLLPGDYKLLEYFGAELHNQQEISIGSPHAVLRVFW
jgi:hypothetical protein